MSGFLRPIASESGPYIGWEKQYPNMNDDIENCTIFIVVCKSFDMIVNDDKYKSEETCPKIREKRTAGNKNLFGFIVGCLLVSAKYSALLKLIIWFATITILMKIWNEF